MEVLGLAKAVEKSPSRQRSSSDSGSQSHVVVWHSQQLSPRKWRKGKTAEELGTPKRVGGAFAPNAAVCPRIMATGSCLGTQTLGWYSLACPLFGILENAQGSPQIRETLTWCFTMPLIQEATVGIACPGRSGQGTHT